MHIFLKTLYQGKDYFENHIKFRKLNFLILISLVLSCILLSISIVRFNWGLIFFSLLLPICSIPFGFKKQEPLEISRIARSLDDFYLVPDLLSTAQEFLPREKENHICSQLLVQADDFSKRIIFQNHHSLKNFRNLALFFLFILLLVLNFWKPWENFPSNNSEESLSEFSDSLKKLGSYLKKDSNTEEIGENLEKGKISEVAQSAQNKSNDFEKGIPKDQEKALETALQMALSQLPPQIPNDIQNALEEMRQNISKPKELKKAALQLSDALKNVEQQKIPKNQGIEKFSKNHDEKIKNKSSQMPSNSEQSGGDQKQNNDLKNPTSRWRVAKTGTPDLGKSKAGGKPSGNALEKIKKAKPGPTRPGKDFFQSPEGTAEASSPQILGSFDKGPELNEQQKHQMKLEQEALAKSRQVDEFCQRHRVPASFRHFLKDFYGK